MPPKKRLLKSMQERDTKSCANGAQPEPEPEPRQILDVCSTAYGHALPKLMRASGQLSAKLVIASTPERGGPPGADGAFDVPVMAGLERLTGYAFPHCIAAYDFKGSSSEQDYQDQVPDKDLADHAWEEPDTIRTTQWFRNFRYWSGRVRAALAVVLLTAEALPGMLQVQGLPGAGPGCLIRPRAAARSLPSPSPAARSRRLRRTHYRT